MSEQTDDKERRVTGIKVPTPWGPVEVRGLGTILTLILCGLVLMGNWLWDGKAEHEKITKAIENVEIATQEQTYVLTLSPERREQLNLQMPKSLRNKIRDRD